ncbi:MAG: aminoglycoside phosphotransferase family protein [Rhizobiaceae bacterium]|nr:aminoglycoside phosphotransferase family protein [Rhizobiaceae bacterium]
MSVSVAANECKEQVGTALRACGLAVSGHFACRRVTSGMAFPSYQGVESETFKVSGESGCPDLFVKISLPELKGMVDHRTAFAAAMRLHELGLAPRPLGADAALGAIVFERLGQDWRVAGTGDLLAEHQLDRLVAIQKLIAGGQPFGRPWSVFAAIDALVAELRRRGARLPAGAARLRQSVSRAGTAIAAGGADLLPAHGDPQTSNLFLGLGGRLKLVDFDMAADMDPYFQLGVQMNELFESDGDMMAFLERYDGAFSRSNFARCRLYAIADDFHWFLRATFLDRTVAPGFADYRKFARWRLLRCRFAIDDPAFERMLGDV